MSVLALISSLVFLHSLSSLTDSRSLQSLQDHVIQAPNSGLEEAEAGAAGQIQAETHPSHLTDAAQRSQRVACPHDSSMDTYRPKRPTTLNLFPQVPRTQVINRFRYDTPGAFSLMMHPKIFQKKKCTIKYYEGMFK